MIEIHLKRSPAIPIRMAICHTTRSRLYISTYHHKSCEDPVLHPMYTHHCYTAIRHRETFLMHLFISLLLRVTYLKSIQLSIVKKDIPKSYLCPSARSITLLETSHFIILVGGFILDDGFIESQPLGTAIVLRTLQSTLVLIRAIRC